MYLTHQVYTHMVESNCLPAGKDKVQTKNGKVQLS